MPDFNIGPPGVNITPPDENLEIAASGLISLNELAQEKVDEPQEQTCKEHDMRECDPAYDGHYSMSYYDNLWGKVTCVKVGCPNAGLSFGKLIKKT